MNHAQITEYITGKAKRLSERELLEEYDMSLDDCYKPVEIGFSTFCASFVLKNCDLIAYRVGFNDWLDSQDEQIVELDCNWYCIGSINEILEALLCEKPELQNAINDWRMSEEIEPS